MVPPELAIMTVEREAPYLRQTLVDMFAKDPLAFEATIRVVASGEDISYAERIVAALPDRPAKLTVERIEPVAWARAIEGPLGARNCTAGYALLQGSGDVLYCQDDLRFSKGWLGHATAVWDKLRVERGDHVAFALYSPRDDFGLGPVDRENGYAVYPPHKFFGAQAVLVSAELRPFLARVFGLASNGQHGFDDMIMQRFFCSTPFQSLFVMVPNVVQHVGRSSSCDCKFHESSMFVEGL